MSKIHLNMNNQLTTKEILENYTNLINERCVNTILDNHYKKNKEKITDETNFVLKFNEYTLVLTNNYTLQHLKDLSKVYKLKVTGNKTELTKRIYSFLKLSNSIIKLQKIARGYILKKYIKYHGPAFYKREICNNSTDFMSMDPIEEIPYNQFFSFEDIDKFIYAFDILSFFNLVHKTEGAILNPYNRKPMHPSVMQNFRSLLRLSQVLKIETIIDLNDINDQISPTKSLEMRVVSLFQNINSLGNYSDMSWFTTLTRTKMLTFVRELVDIWNYRANLSIEVKRTICPPLGDPFGIYFYTNLLNTQNNEEIKEKIVEVLENIVNSGRDSGAKSLGAYYVLSALTLVNIEAANALPWLYEAVLY